jgi:hypothetical protein
MIDQILILILILRANHISLHLPRQSLAIHSLIFNHPFILAGHWNSRCAAQSSKPNHCAAQETTDTWLKMTSPIGRFGRERQADNNLFKTS